MSALRAIERTPYQVMPALTPDEEEWLRNDIKLHGVLVPIEVDEHGAILDGHHRAAIADELGVECPAVVRSGLTEAEKLEHVVSLNIVRRQLSGHDRQGVISLLRAQGLSLRAIGRAVGVSHEQVRRGLAAVTDVTPEYPTPDPEPTRPALPPAPTRRELAKAMRAEGMTQQAIADRLGVDDATVNRLVNDVSREGRGDGGDLPADWTHTRQWLAAVKELPSKTPDPRLVARSVPERNRAGVARSLRQVGTFLGSIALELERSER